MPHDDRGRDWSAASPSQGAPRIAIYDQKLGHRHETNCPQLSEESNLPTTSIPDFQPPELWEIPFLSVVLGNGHSRELVEQCFSPARRPPRDLVEVQILITEVFR